MMVSVDEFKTSKVYSNSGMPNIVTRGICLVVIQSSCIGCANVKSAESCSNEM